MHGMRIKSHRRPFMKNDFRNPGGRPFFFQAEKKAPTLVKTATPPAEATPPATPARPKLVTKAENKTPAVAAKKKTTTGPNKILARKKNPTVKKKV